MSSSFTKLYAHLVWGTKHREPWLHPTIAPRVHGALAERCRDLECVPIAVGGVTEHVHVLVWLRPTIAVADLVRELKAPTAGFVRRVLGVGAFAWQEGYGAFSLRETELDTVCDYVNNQPRHHAEGPTIADWERTGPPRPPT